MPQPQDQMFLFLALQVAQGSRVLALRDGFRVYV